MAQAAMAKGLEPRIYISGSNLSRSRAQPVSIPSLRLTQKSSSLRCTNGGFSSSRHVVVRASVAAAPEKPSTVPEIVLQPIKEISGTINLPGSKSLSNRTLLLAALSEGTTVVDNLLDSDDIHYMLEALKTLGLSVEIDKEAKRAVVVGSGGQFPVGKESKEVQLFLGNAGTAMRPLTAALTVAGGNGR